MILEIRLVEAAAEGNVRSVELLLKKGADANTMMGAPLLRVAKIGCARTVTMLLDHGATPQESTFGAAGQNGDLDTLRILAVHVKFCKRELAVALCHAAFCGRSQAVAYLMDAGAPADDRLHPLAYASRNGQVAIVKLLIANGAPLGASHHHALRMAYNYGHFALGRYLLSRCRLVELYAIERYPDSAPGMAVLRPFLKQEINDQSAAKIISGSGRTVIEI